MNRLLPKTWMTSTFRANLKLNTILPARTFVTTLVKLEDNVEPTEGNKIEEAVNKVEEPVKKVEKRIPKSKLQAWFSENDQIFDFGDKVVPGELKPVQYLGRNGSPFPLNPLFKPSAPLPEDRKQKILESYMSNPKVNTPRSLAIKYKISIRRVEAILKLKLLEKDMIKKGFTLQTNYQVGMENLLGATVLSEPEELEPILPKVGKPLFRAMDEETEFTPEDAAKSLNRPSFSEVSDKLLKDRPFEYLGLRGDHTPDKHVVPKVISKDDLGKHRKSQFMFVDINPNLSLKDRQVFIREKDGVLREATLFEKKYRAKHGNWPMQHKLFRPIAQTKPNQRA